MRKKIYLLSVLGLIGVPATYTTSCSLLNNNISNLLKNTDIGTLKNNESVTISEAVIKKNSGLSKDDFIVKDIKNDSAIIEGISKYSGNIKVTFKVIRKLDEVLKNPNLGEINNNSQETIKRAIISNNLELKESDFILTNINSNSAIVQGQNDYEGEVKITFAIAKQEKIELSTLLKNTNLGILEDNKSSTILKVILQKNSGLSENDFTINQITKSSAIVSGINKYNGNVTVSFSIRNRVELSTILTNTNLGVLNSKDSKTIKKSIIEKNQNLTEDDFMLESISMNSAVAVGINNYIGKVNVLFQLSAVKPDSIQLKEAIKQTNLGTIVSSEPEEILKGLKIKNPNIDTNFLGVRWNGANGGNGWGNVYSLDKSVYIDVQDSGVDVSFTVDESLESTPLSQVITNTNLGMINSNDQNTILQVVKQKNSSLETKYVEVINIGDNQAIIKSTNIRKYKGQVSVKFTIDTSNAMDLANVVTNRTLGLINSNDQDALKSAVYNKNQQLDINSIKFIDILADSALIVSTNPAKYKGNVRVTFSVDNSNAIDLKTVISKTNLGGIPDSYQSSIKRTLKYLNSSLDESSIKATQISKEKATIVSTNPAKYKGSVDVIFEVKTLVGYWYEWGGAFENKMALDQIDSRYNVIDVSFLYSQHPYAMPTYQPNNPSVIKQAIKKLQSQGRRVLISMGGATGGEMLFRSNQKDELKAAIKQTVEEYGFDGLDLDWEGNSLASSESQKVTSDALKEIKDEYKKENRDFIITMAPELPYLRKAGYAGKSYGTFLNELKDYYDWINPQYYNGWGDGPTVDAQDAAKVGVSAGTIISNDNKEKRGEFFYLVTKYMTSRPGGVDNYFQISPDKFVIGAATNEPAGRGAATKDAINKAFNLLKEDSIHIRGLMTWSVLWDGFEGMIPDQYGSTVAKVEWKRWSYAKWYEDSFGKLKNK
ncbi:glycosyl hydrolase family 18 protein [Spiroplasma floricola]|uniref:chitinase n=1 Tax=Spiroplasma floricola 23-6 TaxID=1336749 RepID=A0A2K8SE07_9MOLU|nr:glycosyl hydrolase family 18 protein [Spiroplasma floricola]AUB31696.1 hypothetical protein SFLOR_v1c06460 [Spiroplasma floricola 23-6]